MLAFAGAIVAVNCCVPFIASVAVVGLTVTPVTAKVDVTTQAAVLFPSCVVTVIVAVPPAIAVTRPVALTVATALLLLLQLTF